jgi:hypothetical protein
VKEKPFGTFGNVRGLQNVRRDGIGFVGNPSHDCQADEYIERKLFHGISVGYEVPRGINVRPRVNVARETSHISLRAVLDPLEWF